MAVMRFSHPDLVGGKGRIVSGKLLRTEPVCAPRTHLDALARHLLPEVEIEWDGVFLAGARLDSLSRRGTLLLLYVTAWPSRGQRESLIDLVREADKTPRFGVLFVLQAQSVYVLSRLSAEAGASTKHFAITSNDIFTGFYS